MKLRSILLLPVLMSLLVACGGATQTADTLAPEAEVVAKVEVEPSPTKHSPSPQPTKRPTPKSTATKTPSTAAATTKATEVPPTGTPTPNAPLTPTVTPLHTPTPMQAPPTSTPTYTPTATPAAASTPTPAAAPTPTSIATKTSTPTPLATQAPTITTEATQEFGASGLIEDLESWATVELPYFITASHVDLTDIAFVSKFRANAGHDFSDSFENCCSMKHYFHNIDHYDTRFTQPIYSMVDGVVFYLQEHQAGPGGAAYLKEETGYEAMTGKKVPADYRDWSIYIRPDNAPNVWVQHMHVNPLDEIVEVVPPVSDQDLMRGIAKPAPIGFRVRAGELIAHGLGEIIVKRYLDGTGLPSSCNSGDARQRHGHLPGCRDTVQLHSIFEFMTDSVFAEYQKLTNVSRSDFTFTAEERTANPLKCDGEQFTEKETEGVFGELSSGNFIQFQEPLTVAGRPLDPIASASEDQILPGASTLASGRETIARFEDSGSQVLSKFYAEGPYLLVIASGSGPISLSIMEDGHSSRGVYSRPFGSGVSTYETIKLEPGQIEISVQADEDISWRIVVVKAD